ncbi:MAG: sodium transporter [Verrucomicrobia bacterium]|nr:sodium transporter [Verrucomicrobiota bacterium]
MKLPLTDLAVVIAYFGVVLAIGLRFSRRNRSTESYFLGRRDFPGWAVGLSFIGSTISSVTFIAYPADSFKTAWVRLLPNLAFPFVVTLAGLVFIPFFRSGRVRSAYHYLALRFGPSVSLYAAIVYLGAQLVRTATITYLLAVLLASLTGLTTPACILVAAGLTALYTVKGGFSAVVWTDVMQTVVLMLGAGACVAVVAQALPGGLTQVFSEAWAAGKISFRDLEAGTGRLVPVGVGFSLVEKTALMFVLVGAAQYVAGQLDQDTVQRWCSARSAREARKSMVVLGLGALPIWTTFMFLGTCLWVYYRHFPSDVATAVLAGTRKAEDILPHFILTVLPPGIAGLVISAALAAAMGALSSSINAAGMVWVNDIHRQYLARDRDDAHYLRAGRMASLVMAGLMAGGAWLLYHSSAATMMELSIILLALVGGGISGAFLFGILTRSGDARSVGAGIACTVGFTLYATLAQFGHVPRLFNSYYTSILGNVVMFTTCWLAARLLPAPERDLTDLTVWTRRPADSSDS